MKIGGLINRKIFPYIFLKEENKKMVLKKEPHRERLAGWHPFTDEEINRYVSKGFWHNLTVCDLLDRNVRGSWKASCS